MGILYKYSHFLSQSDSKVFDELHHPGTPTPHSGIYVCAVCGADATSVTGHPLPPQNHHQHPQSAAIQWKLAVWG